MIKVVLLLKLLRKKREKKKNRHRKSLSMDTIHQCVEEVPVKKIKLTRPPPPSKDKFYLSKYVDENNIKRDERFCCIF